MVALSRTALAPCQHIDRLPRGSDRDVGAGYAMAIAAAASAVVYWLVAAVGTGVILTGVGGVSTGQYLLFAVGFVQGAVGVAAVVAPLAFVTGVAVWRVLPDGRSYMGAVGGLLTTVLVYLIPGLLAAAGALVFGVATGTGLAGSVGSAGAVVAVAFVATAWITLPLGVLAGTLYERTRSDDEYDTS